MKTPPGLPAELAARITVAESGCWVWVNKSTRMYRGGRNVQAARLVYNYFHPEFPVFRPKGGAFLEIACGEHLCVNPEHRVPVESWRKPLYYDTLAAARASQTHCIQGHKFTPANTYYDPLGRRVCRKCQSTRNGELVRRDRTKRPEKAAERRQKNAERNRRRIEELRRSPVAYREWLDHQNEMSRARYWSNRREDTA